MISFSAIPSTTTTSMESMREEINGHIDAEMVKVKTALRESGIEVSEAKARSMLLALMNKAREVGDHEIRPADTVVGMFRKQNAHRAKQNFQSRSADCTA